MYATKENMQKRIIFTKHAKQRAKEYDLGLTELVSMLYSSNRRPKDPRRIANKTIKHGRANEEFEFENVSFVVDLSGTAAIVITVHKHE